MAKRLKSGQIPLQKGRDALSKFLKVYGLLGMRLKGL